MMVKRYLFSCSPLTEEEFKMIRDLVYKKSGIYLTEDKKELVKSRLGKILRQRCISSFKEYYEIVVNDSSGKELFSLIDAISTNFTRFFREAQHFEFLKNQVIPLYRENRKINIWSAGCSSGEEPYSIAITLFEEIKDIDRWYINIIATDISTKMIEKANLGIYSEEQLSKISKYILRKYFLKGKNEWRGYYKIKPYVKDKVRFERLNLLDPIPFDLTFDCIFCRNVLIYFDRPTKEKVINKLSNHLKKGGFLFIGHSESLMGLKHNLKYIKPAIYQKI